MPSKHLAVVSINDEDDTDDVAVPAEDLEDIGAPAQVRAHHHHFAVMQAAFATTRVALEEKSLLLHNAEDALMVGRWLALCGQQSVHQGGDAPIAVGGSFIDYPPDQRQEFLIGGFAVMAARCCRSVNTFMQMGSGHAKHVGNRLHREASFSGDASCKLGFFAWALVRASLRISTSMVLRPSRRSSSRTRSSSRRTSELPTTVSSDPTAATPPSAIRRR